MSRVQAGVDASPGSVLLGSVRIAAALILIPQMLGAGIPAMVKVVLVLSLAGLMGQVGPTTQIASQWAGNTADMYGCAFSELVIGMTIGLGVLLAYSAFFMFGKLLDTQMGLAMGQIYDPAGGRNGTIITSLFSQFALLMLFALQFHHHLFRQLAYSFEHMPLCGNGHEALIQMMNFEHVGELLGLGFFMAAPFVLCLFAIDLVVAVISQAAPQFNALLLSMGIKIGLGILLLAMSGHEIQRVATTVYQTAMARWDSLLEAAGSAFNHPAVNMDSVHQGGAR